MLYARMETEPTMRQARVCMRVNNPFTHDARVLREAEALAEAGYDVTVVADARAELPEHATRGAVRVRRIRKTSRIPYASIIRPLREVAADIYHAHDIDSLLPCLVAAHSSRTRARVVYDSHELWSGHARDKIHAKRRLLVRAEGFMLRRADALVTASPAFTEEIIGRYRYTGPAITVLNVPRYFDDSELRDAWARRAADEHIRVMSVGVFQHGRGALPLIRALEFLPEQFVVEFVGPIAQADYEADMRAAAVPFGDRIIFAGAIPAAEVVPRLAQAHVSAVLIEPLSRSYELTAPNKVFDSLMAGTPMIASDMPTIARFVRETEAGMTCDVGDPRSIAAGIHAVADRGDAYSRAARRAAARYHWDAEKRHLLDLYERLTGTA